MRLLRTWAENGKSPGQDNRNDVRIKQICDKLPSYNQQCSDMDSVIQEPWRGRLRVQPCSHPCEHNSKKNTHHSEDLKTHNHTAAYKHIKCLITSTITLQENNFQAPECLCLIIWRSGCDNLISMLVDCSCCSGRELRLFLCLLLNFSYLLPLSWWCTDLHTQNDVTNFWLSQWSHIHTENYDINQWYSRHTQSINLKIFQDTQEIINKSTSTE